MDSQSVLNGVSHRASQNGPTTHPAARSLPLTDARSLPLALGLSTSSRGPSSANLDGRSGSEEQISNLKREVESLRTAVESLRTENKFQAAIRLKPGGGDHSSPRSSRSVASGRCGIRDDGEAGSVVSDQVDPLRMRVDHLEAACKELQRAQTDMQDASSGVAKVQQVMQTEWKAEAQAMQAELRRKCFKNDLDQYSTETNALSTALVDRVQKLDDQLSEVRISIAEVRAKQADFLRRTEEETTRVVAFTNQIEEVRQAVTDREKQQEQNDRLDRLDRLVADTRQDNFSEIVVLRGRVENAAGDLHQYQASINELKSEFELEQKRREAGMAMLISRIENAEQSFRQEARLSITPNRDTDLGERLDVAENHIQILYANTQKDELAMRLQIAEQNLAAVQKCDSERKSDVAAMSAAAAAQQEQLAKRIDLIATNLDTVKVRDSSRIPYENGADSLIQEKLNTHIDRLSSELSGRLDLLEGNVASLQESDKARKEASETDSTQVLSSSVPSLTMSEKDSVGSAAIEKMSHEMKEMQSLLAETCTGLERLALDLAQVREEHTSAISNVGDLTDFVAKATASSIKNAEARIDRQIKKSVAELERTGAAQKDEMMANARSIMSSAGAVRDQALVNSDTPRHDAFAAGYAFAEKMEKLRADVTARIDEASASLREELESKVKATERRMGVVEHSVKQHLTRLDDALARCTGTPPLEAPSVRRFTSAPVIDTIAPSISASPSAEVFVTTTIAAADKSHTRSPPAHNNMRGTRGTDTTSVSSLKKRLEGLVDSVQHTLGGMPNANEATFSSPMIGRRSHGPSHATSPSRACESNVPVDGTSRVPPFSYLGPSKNVCAPPAPPPASSDRGSPLPCSSLPFSATTGLVNLSSRTPQQSRECSTDIAPNDAFGHLDISASSSKQSQVLAHREGRLSQIEERQSDVRQGNPATSEIPFGRFETSELRLRSGSPVMHDDRPSSSRILQAKGMSRGSVQTSAPSSRHSNMQGAPTPQVGSAPSGQRSAAACGYAKGGKSPVSPQAQMRWSMTNQSSGPQRASQYEGGDSTSSMRGSPRDLTRGTAPSIQAQSKGAGSLPLASSMPGRK